MRVVNRYLMHDFMVTFLVTLMVFTFVMFVGSIIKSIDFLARGLSGWAILRAFTLELPFAMSFSIPVSVITAVLLLFGRLSMDGEITAMKASGMSMWQIISPVVFLSIVLSLLCIYINGAMAPKSHFARRQILNSFNMEDPLDLLDEGRFVKNIPGFQIHIGHKTRGEVQDIIVYEYGPRGLKTYVRAESGVAAYDTTNRILQINLRNVRIEKRDEGAPLDLTKATFIAADNYPVRLDLAEIIGSDKITKKAPDMTYFELIAAMRCVRAAFPDLKDEDLARMRMKMLVDANQRLARSLACFAFTLLGIPLGIKSHRKESSIGIGISLLLVFVFYLFIIISDTLVSYPQWRPDLVVWVPVVLAEVLGFRLIRRSE